MFLVVGSTGLLGSEIVRQLRAQNQPVRALVRKTSAPEKVTRLKEFGAEIVEGDLTDKPSLLAACQGVTGVITTATAVTSQVAGDSILKTDQLGQLQLVEAAQASGVQHFIYVSYSRNLSVDCPLTTAKRTVEQRLMGSGMRYTILRPSMYMEVWLSPFLGFDFPNHQARIYGSGQNPLSWISFVDVARVAVMASQLPAAHNAVFELGGPDPLSPNEVVRIFESVSGLPFRSEYVPEEALQAQKSAADDPLQQSFVALMLCMAKGDPINMRQTLQLFPLTLTSVDDYARRALAAGN